MKYRIIPVTSFQQNCSLVWCEETLKGALIDPGGDTQNILKAVDEEGVVLEKILITHGHLDHVGAVKEIADVLNIPIVGPHKADAFWLESLEVQAEMFGLSSAGLFSPDQWLEDGDEVMVGNQCFKVLHCPGHTPGHVAFYNEKTKMAFSGDILFQGSIGRTDFPQGSFEELIASIKNKLFPLGDSITLVPGHGPLTTFGEERVNNPFLTTS